MVRKNDVIVPKDMMRIIEESAANNICVPSTAVEWINWKELLGEKFKIPATFKIQQYHIFAFNSQKPGICWAMKLSLSAVATKADLVKMEFRFTQSLGGGLMDSFQEDFPAVLVDSARNRAWVSLASVSSKEHETRENYLLRKVLDKYYSLVEKDEILKEYLKDEAS